MNVQSVCWIATRTSVKCRSECLKGLTYRLFSSGAPGSRDRRRRFYVEVNVAPCSAPWSDSDNVNKSQSITSAGVDGTDSASGVSRSLETDNSNLRKYLQPRIPGKNYDETVDNKDTLQWYSILLDGRPLRSPLGRRLAVPSIHLAHGIAAEWNAVGMQGAEPTTATTLGNHYIVPSQMPFMRLACTALDQTSSHIQIFQEQCLRFLHTDTICYWADPIEDRVLYGRQQSAWQGIHEWIETDFAAPDKPVVAIGSMEGMILARGRKGLGHPDSLVKFCGNWIASLDAWHLTAMHSICADSKSFWVAAALLMKNHNRSIKAEEGHAAARNTKFKMDIDRALAAARVEEEFNIENWGLVEGGHDYDRLNVSIQINSSSLLVDYVAIALKT